MGGMVSTPPFIDQEKTSWVRNHTLECEPGLATQYRNLVSNFKDGCNLYLCYEEKKKLGYPYQHWFVTDRTWVIEFGSGDILNNLVVVHAHQRKGYIIEDKFMISTDVRNRMLQVCGASNYSLALRNCEHVARYIQSGIWVSFQMAKNSGFLFGVFKDYLSSHTKLINTFPIELEPVKPGLGKIYEEYTTCPYSYRKTKQLLTEADNDSYNVVFIGPTGCGKSTLINTLFNQTVVNAAASAVSVTRRVEFLEGRTILHYDSGRQTTKSINVIDTLGFCDSVFTADQVLSMIKSSLQLNLAKIDKVLIVCSGRIEKQHAQAIKQFMNWLQYDKNKGRFCFIYNKSDGLTEGEKVTCLLNMCEMLGADTKNNSVVATWNGQKINQRQNINLGFPPTARFEEVKPNLSDLDKAVCSHDPKHPRIELEKSACTIL